MTTGVQSFFIETWGCQMNDLDTQRLSGQLKVLGWERTDDEAAADLILLNTCSIRNKAEQKVFSRLGRLRSLKETRGTKFGVCGCVAQQEGEAILKRVPWVDFVMGPGSVGQIGEILEGSRRVALGFPEDRRYDYESIERPSAIRAQVTIIEGCNKNCTFCVVPTTRGREVSRTAPSIVAEVEHAVRTGRVEIELLGQTVNAYRCPDTGASFGDLLRLVASVEGVLRLRFITSHPADVDRRMIEAMRDHENICRFLHLPAQSGSNRVLRRMKRLYTRERYLQVIDEIRSEMPDMRFSGDFIVGFPGETEDDFSETLSLIESVQYGSLFAFCYSPRPGTAAPRLGDPVPEDVSGDRLGRLLSRQENIERVVLDGYVGKVRQVLFEGPSKLDGVVMSGKTDDNWTVNFLSRDSFPVGSMLEVLITEAQHHTLRGEVRA